jgi:hypothetical protein
MADANVFIQGAEGAREIVSRWPVNRKGKEKIHLWDLSVSAV